MKNRCDLWLSRFYARLPFETYTLIDRAARTLEANSGSLRTNAPYPWSPLRGILPSDGYFAGVWNWDSAFHMMGVCRWDVNFARDQFRILQKVQLPDGMFPDVWRCPDGSVFSGGSKPPVLPWAVWAVEQAESDPEFLLSAYDSLLKNESFWENRRCRDGLFFYDGESDDPKERKLFGGWESGWDDSPRWDGGVNRTYAIDLNCYMILFYRSLCVLAGKLGRDAEARRWTEKEIKLTAAVESRLWNESAQGYFDYDFADGVFSDALTPASFMPLFIGIATPERAAAMAKLAVRLSPGWPSISYDAPTYNPVGYWRGRTWLNIAYFALKGLKFYGYSELAETGRRTLLEWVARDPGSIYENYNSATGMPVGAPRFSWSCVFVLKFLLDWDLPRDAEMPRPGAR